jgi:hypothetical protein
MTHFEVLVEGLSDVPVVNAIFLRRFPDVTLRVHPHQGKGQLPSDVFAKPDPKQRQLLHQLPSKLRGYRHTLQSNDVVLVLCDADKDKPDELLKALNGVLDKLKPKYRVLFHLAVEETESWFIADYDAVKKAYPSARIAPLKNIKPDAIVGAWEKLAEALGEKGEQRKIEWATRISPYLNVDKPVSPSLKKLIDGVANATTC